MTPTTTNTMTLTDEEIRVKVAELMGYYQIEQYLDGAFIASHHEHGRGELPDYLNDKNAALQLCDRMHSEGWEPMIQRPSGIWHVQFTHKDSWKPDVHKMPVSASHRSLARAVTLCFLAAHSN